MTTLEITFSLPDSVANEAKAAGLLASDAIAQFITQALRRKSYDALLPLRPTRICALPGERPPTGIGCRRAR